MKQQKINYGNWISLTLLRIFYSVSGLLLLLCCISALCFRSAVFSIVLGTLFVLALAVTVFMHLCRWQFSFEGGGLMGKIHMFLLDHMDWDGCGRLLDIGCGAAALTVRCAKKYPQADITGIDYWGFGWDYAKAQCENNAKLEGVAENTHFRKGDASKLDFADETFDAAVSNFVFHEVKKTDKRLVVREALRVVKKGGSFAFQDLFGWKKLYGDMNEFIDTLKTEGITEINYIPNVEQQGIIPKFMKIPGMMTGVGLIYGKK